jgi:peptidoglycan/xylan/chitin deacetylase (PgdA/CDA1 family)
MHRLMIKHMKLISISFFTLTLLLIYSTCWYLFSPSFQISYSTGKIILPPLQNGSNSSKIIILAFDDSPKSQFTLAKPILDKYGYKGSFFTVCNFVNNGINRFGNESMSWQNIKSLQQQGHDIESHTMTHTALHNRSQQDLIYEIGGSKQCLFDHGINTTIFAYPASTGSENATIINIVSKYYDLARSGDAPLAFLHCNGYKKTNDCIPFKNGKVKYENRYDIKNWSDRPKAQGTNQDAMPMNNTQMFSQFIKEVNLQSSYNKNGCINAIPIVVYHNFLIDKNYMEQPDKSITDIGLFSKEMKYLHDNGFLVLKISDLGYNQSTNYIYIKGPTTSQMKNC